MSRAAKPADRPRAWQRMLSGRRLDLLDPSPLDIEIEDIAQGLARVARWNGQTRGDHAFSVAQHSLLVEALMARREADPRWHLAALLHDAPEYVIGDMIAPFKAVMGGDYRSVERRLQEAVHLRFGLPRTLPSPVAKAIKDADRLAAFLEATTLAGFSLREAASFFGEPPAGTDLAFDLVPQATAATGVEFLARFRLLDAACRNASVPERTIPT